MDLSEKIMAGVALSFVGFVLTDVYAGFVAAQITIGIVTALGIGIGTWIAIQRLRLHLRRQTAEVVALETDSKVRFIKGRSGILQYEANGTSTFFHRSARLPKPDPLREPEPVPAAPLLNLIAGCDCLLVYGGRGAGKTNFLQWLAAAKVRAGEQLWIIDPKPSRPGKWPHGVNVIGQGGDYAAIETISGRYMKELERRKGLYRSVGGFPKITAIVDELHVLNLQIDGFMRRILPLLIEGREYNIHLILISQSKTAGSIGFKGMYDLLQCFDAMVGLRKVNGDYQASADFGDGEDIPASPPGAYRASTGVSCHTDTTRPTPCHTPEGRYGGTVSRHDRHDSRDTVTPEPVLIPDMEQEAYVWEPEPECRFYESGQERKIVEMYEAGHSLNSIARAIWGNSNGRRTKALKAVLSQHGLRHHT